MSEPLQRWRIVVVDEYGHLLSQPFAVVRVQPIADGEYGTWVRYADIEALERERDQWRVQAGQADRGWGRAEEQLAIEGSLHQATRDELAEALRQIDSLTKRLAVSGDPLKVFT